MSSMNNFDDSDDSVQAATEAGTHSQSNPRVGSGGRSEGELAAVQLVEHQSVYQEGVSVYEDVFNCEERFADGLQVVFEEEGYDDWQHVNPAWDSCVI